jgi:hypothetical protein
MNRKGFQRNKPAWNRGLHLTELHKLHISQSTQGVLKPWLRKPFTKEHIENMSKALTGVPKTEEHKRNMSIGKQLSNERRDKQAPLIKRK